MNKKIITISKNIIVIFIITISLISIQNIFAEGSTPTNDAILSGAEKLEQFAGEAGIKKYTNPISVATNIINFALGFLGLFFLVLIIVGGFQWMTSAGEDEKVNKARAIIKSATIGLIIVIGSWIIASTILALFRYGTGAPSPWIGGSYGWW